MQASSSDKGGYWFSWGMPYLAQQAQELGMETDIYEYTQVNEAWAKIKQKKKDGYKIALVGFSLGNTTITWLQRYLAVDLLLSIAESSLGANHPIKRTNTKRSVLWYGPDFLSNAGLQDGFDETNYVNNFHLGMNIDPRVVSRRRRRASRPHGAQVGAGGDGIARADDPGRACRYDGERRGSDGIASGRRIMEGDAAPDPRRHHLPGVLGLQVIRSRRLFAPLHSRPGAFHAPLHSNEYRGGRRSRPPFVLSARGVFPAAHYAGGDDCRRAALRFRGAFAGARTDRAATARTRTSFA